jgi:hypothetical protein
MVSLKEFVKLAKEKGLSKIEITSELRKKGYSDDEITEAFGNSITSKTNKSKDTSDIEPLEKIKMLFLEPSGFFSRVRDETISRSLILYTIISLIMIFIRYGLIFALGQLGSNYRYSGILGGGLFGLFGIYSYAFIIFFFVGGIILTFVYSGIVHLTAKIAGGEGGFVDSYNAVTYSLIVSSILSIIPVIGMLAFIYSIVLAVFGISEYHKISKGKAVTAVLSPLIIFVCIILILLFFALRNFHVF